MSLLLANAILEVIHAATNTGIAYTIRKRREVISSNMAAMDNGQIGCPLLVSAKRYVMAANGRVSDSLS